MEKVRTGIKELDEILDGGIPKGNIVLLAGAAGTGKTILSQQFIFCGARDYNETGAYISFSEPRDKLLTNLSVFNFFDHSLIDRGKVKIMDITQDARLLSIEPLTPSGIINMITSMVREGGCERLVVDSVTAICNSLATPKSIRNFIFELGVQLSYLDCTTILTSETPPMSFQFSPYGIEEFISDGVILLGFHEQRGELIRTLQVVKMRGVNHSRLKYLMDITPSGIVLKPMFEL